MNELWHKRHHAQVANMALEPCRAGHGWEMALDGWAVFTGSEGEDPTFRAFFVDEDTARTASEVRLGGDDDGDPLFFDPCVSVAVVTPRGIIASNDCEIDTHEKLRAKLAESWWDDERLVSGCIGRELNCGCPKCKPAGEAPEHELLEKLRAAEADASLWKAIAQRNDGEVRRVVSEANPTFTMKSSAMSIVAATCRDFIDSVPEAKNYCSLGFEDDKGRLELVIQRPEGESPATRAERFEGELKAVGKALGWYSWKCGFMVPHPPGSIITDESRLRVLVDAHERAKAIGDVPDAG